MESTHRILLIEENDIDRRMLENILADYYDLVEVEDHFTAIKTLIDAKDAFDAIIVDLSDSADQGFGILKDIIKIPDIAKIPVIALVDNDREAENFVLKNGAFDYITKPFERDIILHRISNIVKLTESVDMVRDLQCDILTGVYNKNIFYNKVRNILMTDPEGEYQIVIADLERFKLYNDVYGAEEGDKLLMFCARTLKEAFKDGIVFGRLVNDQFAIFTSENMVKTKNVITSAAKVISEYKIKAKINIKFGVYPVIDKHLDVSTMCDRAVMAIKEIKGKFGIDYKYYDESLRNRLLLEHQITNSMAEALKNEEFKVYIQPKYDLSNEKISGGEALVRWISPTNGFLSPDKFIQIFEKNGFITQLDMFVWEKTCQIIREMMDRYGKTVPISVNVSRADLFRMDILEVLTELLKKYRLRPDQIHLEITETAYTDNPEQLLVVISKLKKKGFIIEMDDFGSGYSSLNMLSELPIDTIKLDMKFMRHLNRKNDVNILSFVISMAKWLGYTVVAEGVETSEQISILRNMECDYAQGYYYSKPVPSVEFMNMIYYNDISDCPVGKDKITRNMEITIPSSYLNKTMLVVDDMKINRAVLKDIFSGLFKIEEAEDGLKALNYLRDHLEDVAVVMLDLVMPVMDGYELLDRMKSDDKYKHIPVIITSQMGVESEVKALEMGADDFITKPYYLEIVKKRLENVLCAQEFKNKQRGALDLKKILS